MLRVELRPEKGKEWERAAELVRAVSSRAFGVKTESLLAKSRSCRDVAFARQAAMYLLHVVFGGTYKEVGDVFGRERTTVAYACALVEDERDDARFDRKLDTLEERLEKLWAIEKLRARQGAKVRAAA